VELGKREVIVVDESRILPSFLLDFCRTGMFMGGIAPHVVKAKGLYDMKEYKGLLEAEGIQVIMGKKIKEITDKDVVLVDPATGREERIPCDNVVTCEYRRPRDELAKQLLGKIPVIHVVGDALEPRTILEATYEGWAAGLEDLVPWSFLRWKALEPRGKQVQWMYMSP
jgi:NADPH-dependent 2,4-dienoyl-CoA reductase/sulfur reductase-like enzyme